MSTRITQLGADAEIVVSNNTRVTQLGADVEIDVSNSSRITQLGAEVEFTVLTQAHAISGYLRDAIITHIFRTAILSKPSQLWVALYTIPPSDTDPGAEVAGNGYARAQLNPGEVNWNPPTTGDGQTSNGVDLAFAAPTGSGWGTLTAWGLFDAATGGNLLAYSTFTTGIDVPGGSNPRFLAGDLTVTLS